MPLSDFFGASTMSDADEIEIHVEAIVAELVDRGLRDPAWIANAYIERIDPDRRLVWRSHFRFPIISEISFIQTFTCARV